MHRRSERGGAVTAAGCALSPCLLSAAWVSGPDVQTRFVWTEQLCAAPPAPTPPWGGRLPGTCAGACVPGAVLREHPAPHAYLLRCWDCDRFLPLCLVKSFQKCGGHF